MAGNPYAAYIESNPYSQFAEDLPKPVMRKIGVEGLPDAVKAVAGDFNPLTQASVGAKSAWDLAAMRLKQLVGGTLTPQQEQEVRANRALLQASPMAQIGNIATNMAATAPMAGLAYAKTAGAVGNMLPSWMQFLAPSAGAAVVGAALPAVTEPVLPGESGLANMGRGAASGIAADALTRGAARLVQPITQSPAVQDLLSKNIIPTPGQAAGGAANKIEERAMSVPLIGDVVSGARNRAREELGAGAINVGMPKDLQVGQAGNAGVAEAKANLSQGYKNLYGTAEIGRDAQLLQDLGAAVNKPLIPLSKEYKKAYDRVITTEVLDRLPQGQTFPAGKVKEQVEAGLGQAIRKLGPMPSGQDLALKESLEAARTAVRNLAGRGAGIDQGRRAALDRGYANMKDMATAASRAEANGGIPTPLQIINAAKSGTKLETLGRNAQEVLGNRVPNSGTTDRLLQALLLGGLGAGASTTEHYQETPYLNQLGPAFWLGLAASPLAYSRPGSRYMVGDLIPGQPALAGALRQAAPYAAQAGALAAPY